jgi:hypothetical protein
MIEPFLTRHRTTLQALAITAGIVVIQLGVRALVHAGTDNTLIEHWPAGNLREGLGLLALLIGFGGCAARLSLAWLFAGIGAYIGLNVGPTIISQVVSGTF